MPDISQLLQLLETWLITPVYHQLLGLFDLNGRIGLPFLLISLGAAWLLYLQQRQWSARDDGFWQFLGGRQVFLHPSALLDYRYYFVRAILKVAVVVPVIGLVDPFILRSGDWLAFFNNLWSARPQLGENLGLSLLYGLGVFLLRDFIGYWLHRAFHSRWLWEFHKVHHSAPVMVPMTASRVHILEKIASGIVTLALVSLYAGLFWHLCGGKVSSYTLFGVTWVMFVFNALASNLRHSHVWLSFGPKLEHIFNSPAQHQIHHSAAPEHYNRNFGTSLSIWDWMFGTLYTTTRTPEKLSFGTAEQDSHRYLTLWSLTGMPFVDTARKLLPRRLLRRASAVE